VSRRGHQSSSRFIISSLKLVGVSSDVWLPVSTDAYYTNCLVTDWSCAAANCSRKHSLTHAPHTNSEVPFAPQRNARQRTELCGAARSFACCRLNVHRSMLSHVTTCHVADVGCSDEQLHANVVYLSLSPTTVIRATYSIERCCLSNLSLVCV